MVLVFFFFSAHNRWIRSTCIRPWLLLLPSFGFFSLRAHEIHYYHKWINSFRMENVFHMNVANSGNVSIIAINFYFFASNAIFNSKLKWFIIISDRFCASCSYSKAIEIIFLLQNRPSINENVMVMLTFSLTGATHINTLCVPCDAQFSFVHVHNWRTHSIILSPFICSFYLFCMEIYWTSFADAKHKYFIGYVQG